MIEARLTLAPGTTPPIQIPDLNLTMVLGGVYWTDADAARKSACVAALFRTGKIRVSYERRNIKPMTQKPATPTVHSVALSRPGMKPVMPVSQTPPPAQVDVEKLALAVAQAVALQHQPVKVDLEALIEKAVQTALSRLPAHANVGPISTSSAAAPDDPVYIPSNIVGDTPVEIKTTAGVSDATGLADAAKALKSVNRPKRVRKQDHGEEQ